MSRYLLTLGSVKASGYFAVRDENSGCEDKDTSVGFKVTDTESEGASDSEVRTLDAVLYRTNPVVAM